MITVNLVDYMKCESQTSEIVRPQGSGDYLFLYFPVPMKWYTNDGFITTQKNACVLLHPTNPHRFCGAPDFQNTFIHFLCSENEAERFDIPFGKILYPHCFETLNRLSDKVKNEFVRHGAFYEDMIHSYVLSLLALLGRSIAGGGSDTVREQFEQLRHDLLSDCSKDISVSELSSKMCMSRSSFYEHYRKYFNSSPKHDLLKARMETAAVMLADRSRTVSETALELGFENAEHFTRYYKKYFGRSPRRKYLDKTSN